MLVGVDGERRMGVTESFGNDLDRYAVGDEEAGVGVPEVVKSDRRESGTAHDP